MSIIKIDVRYYYLCTKLLIVITLLPCVYNTTKVIKNVMDISNVQGTNVINSVFISSYIGILHSLPGSFPRIANPPVPKVNEEDAAPRVEGNRNLRKSS